jgi:hypothetical protein
MDSTIIVSIIGAGTTIAAAVISFITTRSKYMSDIEKIKQTHSHEIETMKLEHKNNIEMKQKETEAIWQNIAVQKLLFNNPKIKKQLEQYMSDFFDKHPIG